MVIKIATSAGVQFAYSPRMANRIKEVRAEKQVTLDELAARLSTSKGQVAALQAERRQLTLAWLKRIANALDCKISDLLADEDVSHRLSPAEDVVLKTYRAIPAPMKGTALAVLSLVGSEIAEDRALANIAAVTEQIGRAASTNAA